MTNLKQLREWRGMSQAEVAAVLGVSRSTVAMWETSTAYPRGKVVVQLAETLNCSIDELFGRAPPAPMARDSA